MARRKLRMALMGGGGTGFIGKVHATAAQLDQQAELVAGVFSSNPEKSRDAAAQFHIASGRSYGTLEELLEQEFKRSANERPDFMSIATPNYLHFPMAMAALEAGLDVVCEKPMTTNLADATRLAAMVRDTGRVFVLLHNYTGYPMIRQVRQMIRDGELGDVQAVRVNYIQGGMRGWRPDVVPPRGAWKSDPALAGPSGSLGDIGTHAYQLARYVTGIVPRDVSCQLANFIEGRALDDYGNARVRGQRGELLWISFSQSTHGRFNDLILEVDGSLASISWCQEEPNQLVVRRFGKPAQVYDRHPTAEYMNAAGREATRLPAGHPEAFFEAFANVFRAGFEDMHARREGQRDDAATKVYPSVEDGWEGVLFVEQCLASHREEAAWKPLQAAN